MCSESERDELRRAAPRNPHTNPENPAYDSQPGLVAVTVGKNVRGKNGSRKLQGDVRVGFEDIVGTGIFASLQIFLNGKFR